MADLAADTSRSRPARARLIGLLVLGTLVAAVASCCFYFRATYGTWNPAARPNRIDRGDCRYYPYGSNLPVKPPRSARLRVVQSSMWPLPQVLVDVNEQDPSLPKVLYVRTWDGKLWWFGVSGVAQLEYRRSFLPVSAYKCCPESQCTLRRALAGHFASGPSGGGSSVPEPRWRLPTRASGEHRRTRYHTPGSRDRRLKPRQPDQNLNRPEVSRL